MCPNCKNMIFMQRDVCSCKHCGYIFTNKLEIMDGDKIRERTTIRRIGKNVDRLDG